jgi:hypothetical protein
VTFVERILAFLDRRELELCPCVDATGLYTCNQPGIVFHRELESAMCLRCFKETP